MKTELIQKIQGLKSFNRTRVVAITGHKGAGKSEFSAELIRELERQGAKTEFWGFAAELKNEIILLFLDDVPFAYPDEFFTAELKAEFPPIRKLLQEWGDWRKSQDPDYWINAWLKVAHNFLEIWEYKEKDQEDWMEREDAELDANKLRYIIVPDLRFLDEGNTLREAFGDKLTVVRVMRPGETEGKDTHNSEVEQNGIFADFTIHNNDTLDQLKADARHLTLSLK